MIGKKIPFANVKCVFAISYGRYFAISTFFFSFENESMTSKDTDQDNFEVWFRWKGGNFCHQKNQFITKYEKKILLHKNFPISCQKIHISECQLSFAIIERANDNRLITAGLFGHFFVYKTQISKLISNTVFKLLSLC